MVRGFAGMWADDGEHDAVTRVNAEATLEIPFGGFVAEGSTAAAAILPVAANAKLVGPLVHSHEYNALYDLGTIGVKPKVTMAICRVGRVYLKSETTVAKGDRVFVRYAAGAGGTQLGAVRNAAVASETIEVKGCYFDEAAGAGAIVPVQIDMNAFRSHL